MRNYPRSPTTTWIGRRLVVVLTAVAALAGSPAVMAPVASADDGQPTPDLSVLSPEEIRALAVVFAPCDPSGSPTSQDAANAAILNDRLRAKLDGHMDAGRVACARMIVQTVQSRQLPQRAAVIAITTAIVESGLQNYATAVDHDSLGLFQQRPSQGWGTPDQLIDPVYATNAFLNAMLRVDSWMTEPIGQVCQAVQRSAFPDRYQLEAGDAQIIVDLLWQATVRGVDVASWGSDRLDVFARGADDRLMHRWWVAGSWSVWEDLGGALRSDPTAVSWGDGRLDVFARGPGNVLLHRYFQRGDGWSDWEQFDANLADAPEVASWGPRRLDVFGRNPSDQLVHKAFRGDSWGPWEQLNGSLRSGPTAVSWDEGRIDVFARGRENLLLHKAFRGGSWGPWEQIEANLAVNPDVASWGPGRLDVFGANPSNQLVHKEYRGGGFSAWHQLPANLASSPTAVSRAEGLIDVFAVNPSGELVHKARRTDGSWAGWQQLGVIP